MAEQKKIEIDVLINTSKSAKSVKDLTSSLEELKSVASDMDTTGEEFKKISQQISITDTKVKNLTKSMEGLDADAKAGELGKLAGGLSAVGAAAALAFAGNEDAEKFFQTFAKGIAITNAVKGGIESYTASVKLLTKTTILQDTTTKLAAAGQLLYSTAVGTSTGALKLFRLALIGTGIGAIIVGIGLLISNFDKVSEAVSNAVKKFREMGPVMKIILYPITLLIAGFDGIMFVLEKLGVVDDENTKKMKANADERVLNSEKEMKAVSDKYDLEIRKAQAAGKDVTEIEQEKRRAILETIRVQGEAIRAQIIATGSVTEEQKTKLKELTELAKKTGQDIVVADIANNTKRNEEQKKIDDENKKKREERAKVIKDIESKERRDLQEAEVMDWELFGELDDEIFEKEFEKQQLRTQQLLDGQEVMQEEELESQLDFSRRQIEAAEVVRDTKQQIQDQSLNNIEDGIGLLTSLAGDSAEAQAAGIIAENVAGIARTIISTSASNAKITAEGAALAIPSGGASVLAAAGLITANNISAGISVASSIAAASKGLSQLKSSKSPGSGSKPGGSSASPAPTINPQNLFSTQQLQGAETEQVSSGGPGQQQVIKAVVSERDITTVQDRMRNYERISEIG